MLRVERSIIKASPSRDIVQKKKKCHTWKTIYVILCSDTKFYRYLSCGFRDKIATVWAQHRQVKLVRFYALCAKKEYKL